ncbi:integral membrane protein, YkoY family [Evansella caseinilytica]|uniref:Integral membrane protein, YkoY family n=1 Tax=Evansella caseinilytica TaxID=1503961 RepID=A0A1H3QU34_9BACI|nr:TerC family protein [Evansella caseinilytica]SDZ16783.1 integral membrane protein, YkoY family [Evansella caseinilytica]
MDLALLLEYAWVLLVLIGLEGILAADNALVLAIMVKHLPEKDRKKALFYGLAGAFIFRFSSLFIISFLIDVWQVQAIGAIYLLYISFHHLLKKYVLQKNDNRREKVKKLKKGSGFWMTVLKVEIADIAFAVDSILAAIALALTLTPTGLFQIGQLDGGQFIVILTGGLIGVIIMRFAATYFVRLLHRRPGLETAAFLIVGWVGIKLVVYTLAHHDIAVLNEHFPESTLWKGIFWTVLIIIAAAGWLLTGRARKNDENKDVEQSLSNQEELLQKPPPKI